MLVPLAFLAVFFAWPVAAIIGRGLHPGGHWDLGVVGRVLSDPAYRQVAWFTLWEATASTAVTLVVALPMAALFGRFEFPGKRVLWALLIVPFVLPTVVVGVAFLALLGPGGALGVDLRGSIWLILIAHAFFNVAVVVRTVGGLWGNLDPRLEEAARTLGASRLRAFREVTLPRLRPAIAAAASIVFLFCFTSFGVVLLLGGIRARTLEVEIYDQTTQLLHLDVAAVLAILQLVGVGLALVLYGRHQQREGGAGGAAGPGRGGPPTPGAGRVGVRHRHAGLHGAAAGYPAGGAGLAVVHHGGRQRAGGLAGAGDQPHRQRAVRVAARGGGELVGVRPGGHRHRRGGGRVRQLGHRPPRRGGRVALVRRRAHAARWARRRPPSASASSSPWTGGPSICATRCGWCRSPRPWSGSRSSSAP